jgi:Flp pilus assembly protein TadG
MYRSKARAVSGSRRRGERGAVLVEAAATATVFFTLLFGVLEAGFLMSDYLATTSGARAATRAATTKGNDADADYAILRQIKRETSALPTSNIQKIIIFKAAGPGAAVPSACLSATVHQGITNSGTNTYCNVYDRTDLTAASSNFGCTTSYPTYYDCGWDPKTRRVAVSTGVTPDYIGLYIKVTHPAITGFFTKSYTFLSTVVYPLEPRALA